MNRIQRNKIKLVKDFQNFENLEIGTTDNIFFNKRDLFIFVLNFFKIIPLRIMVDIDFLFIELKNLLKFFVFMNNGLIRVSR